MGRERSRGRSLILCPSVRRCVGRKALIMCSRNRDSGYIICNLSKRISAQKPIFAIVKHTKTDTIMKKTNLLTALMMLMVAAMPAATYARNNTNNSQDMKSKKTLVVFFSRTGENYAVGNIAKGNTHIVAEIIAEQTGGTLFQIEPVAAYPEKYKECTELAKREVDTKARPAIKGDIAVEEYDTIYIGYPNWWSDMPMPVYTFIEKHNWQGKTVVPFCTHEGSGLSATESKLKKACEGAAVLGGLALRGSVAQKSQEQTRTAVANWLAGLKR